MNDEIDKIMLDFKNGLLTLGDARNKILRLVFREIKSLLDEEKNFA